MSLLGARKKWLAVSVTIIVTLMVAGIFIFTKISETTGPDSNNSGTNSSAGTVDGNLESCVCGESGGIANSPCQMPPGWVC